MNKLLVAFSSLAALVIVWYVISPSEPSPPNAGTTTSPSNSPANNTSSDSAGSANDPGTQSRSEDGELSNQANVEGEEGEGFVDKFDRPATELYSSASEALDAVKKGASTYDDIVLEQFVDLGENCTWCDEFYGSVRSLATGAGLSADERSYYSEILAISGNVENIGELINGIESAPSSDEAEIYTEALEIAIGNDEVVDFLDSKLASANKDLQESIVAAISNQGSAKTVEVLFNHVRASGNPDGYYSEGTGPGEVIPEDEAFPFLKQEVSKRDEYSHLAVKALLNSGLDGVKTMVDLIGSSPSPKDSELLVDAADHVNLDEPTEKYFREVVTSSPNPTIAKFGEDVLKAFADDAAGEVDPAPKEAE